MEIYKYASLDSGLKILDSNSLILSYPDDFNDTFDSEFLINDNGVKFGFEIITNYMLENELLKAASIGISHEKGFKRIIYKRFIRKISKRRKRGSKNGSYYPLITLQYIKFMAKVFGFTIPKDNAELANESFKQIQEHINNNIKTMKDIVKNSTNKLLITCFSKRPDNFEMWTYYGGSNKGVCIEYEEDNNLVEVIYHKKMKSMKFSKFCMMYNASLINNSDFDIKLEKMLDILPITVKPISLKHEEEIRIITEDKDARVYLGEINGKDKRFINMNRPIRVISGVDMSADDKLKLKEKCERLGIKYAEAHKNSKKYRIIVD